MAEARRPRPSRRVRSRAAASRTAGTKLTCAVLATGSREWAAVDLASGSFVRARPDEAASLPSGRFALFDVVTFGVASDEEPPDPARPEGVPLGAIPTTTTRLRRRTARRLVRRLAVPEQRWRALLGTHGPSVAYVDLDVRTPSIEIVEVAAKSLRCFVRDDGQPYCSFTWSGTVQALPLLDERVVARLGASTGELDPGMLADAAGGRPGYLLIALGAVRDGHAPKVVCSIIARRPRPGRRTAAPEPVGEGDPTPIEREATAPEG